MKTTQNPSTSQKLRLQRPHQGRVLGGVAAAISERTGSSVGLIRLGFLIAGLLGGFGVVLYVAAWALIPGEDEAESAGEKWLANLTTPGKRAGAFFVGLAALVVLAGAAPATVWAAIVLLGAAALLSSDRTPAQIPTATVTAAAMASQDPMPENSEQ